MDIWAILGIESTKDEAAITAAYHNKLKLVHPEEHPQEFMELRRAYESALAAAKQEQEQGTMGELSPLDAWIARVQEIYQDYPQRIDTQVWRELLDDEVCQSLDSRRDAMDGMLAYLMDNFYMPRSIWRLLNDEFDFKGNASDLYERFPKRFIDEIVISGIDSDVVVPYELFDPGTSGNPDRYFDLFFKARGEIRDENLEAAAATIADIDASGIEHPFTDLLRARLLNAQGKGEEALTIADELREFYPDQLGILQLHGDLLQGLERYSEALEDFEAMLETRPKDFSARLGAAECLKGMGELAKARDKLIELGNDHPYDPYITRLTDETVAALKEQNERRFQEDSGDFETAMEYLWTCLQSQEYDKAKELRLKVIPQGLEQTSDYENFSTKLFTNTEDYQEAYDHSVAWLEAVEQLPEGETEEQKKRKGKPGEILYLQANALLGLKRYEEAIEVARRSEELRPTDVGAVDVRRRCHLALKRYDDAVEDARHMVELHPNLLSNYFLGLALYEAGQKYEAYQAFEEAQRYQPDLSCYLMRIRILCDFGEWDFATQELDFLEEHGCNVDCHKYLRARVAQGRGDEDGALAVYRELIAKQESEGTDIFFIWELYNLCAELEEGKKEPREILDLVEKGLKAKDDYLPLLNYRAFLLRKLERYQEALDAYLKIKELAPNHRTANQRIANLYYDEFDEYEKALTYYRAQLDMCDDAHIREMAALCLMYLGRTEESEVEFKKSIELDPAEPRPYSNLGLLYERRFDFERSIPLQEEAVARNMAKDEGDRDPSIYSRFARALVRSGRRAEAINAYEQSISAFKRKSDAQKMVTVCLMGMELQKAEELIRHYFDPVSDAEKYFDQMATIRELQGNEQDFLRCLEAMPYDSAIKYRRLAEYYADRGKNRKANSFYAKLMRLDEDDMGSLHSHAGYLRSQGRVKEADEEAARYLQRVERYAKYGWETPFYLTQKAFALIVAGRHEEALPLIHQALREPLCDHCIHCRCKDAYIALCEYHLARGDHQAARQACFDGLQIAP
ncbi:MAG: tetratricopeptide repeat protein, partial [Coriobacteriales bacterium]|nr:tetratricopeptide repeat protein [Coriobacteriales bacterium]